MKNEMKLRTLTRSICVLVFLFCLPTSAYANSSWHWFTKQPWTILPVVVVITLLMEVGTIYFSNRMKPSFVSLSSIVAANLLSFLFPLVATRIFPSVGMENDPFFERLDYFTSYFPFYMVNMGFLFLTLIVELPIVYFVLKKYVTNKKRLFWSILLVNCLTTLIIAVIERLLFKGSW